MATPRSRTSLRLALTVWLVMIAAVQVIGDGRAEMWSLDHARIRGCRVDIELKESYGIDLFAKRPSADP